ncbi:MAG: hypothetical protein K6B42_07570 [Clostridia bacterium]|nr:hypothetical protein [Clostridia bacterium]
MRNVTKILEKITEILRGSATIKSGTISFPYTAECDGVLTIRIKSNSAGSSTNAYAYFAIGGTTVGGWHGSAVGGTASVSFGVKKDEVVTMNGTQISAFNYRLVPILIGGGVRLKGSILNILTPCRKVVGA